MKSEKLQDLLNVTVLQVTTSHLFIDVLVDSVVINATVEAQRDGHLTGTTLALAHQEAAVDAATQQVLGVVARHRSVIPATKQDECKHSTKWKGHVYVCV